MTKITKQSICTNNYYLIMSQYKFYKNILCNIIYKYIMYKRKNN
jgi:hypothetical protein